MTSTSERSSQETGERVGRMAAALGPVALSRASIACPAIELSQLIADGSGNGGWHGEPDRIVVGQESG